MNWLHLEVDITFGIFRVSTLEILLIRYAIRRRLVGPVT
jgi:hypothetical protein